MKCATLLILIMPTTVIAQEEDLQTQLAEAEQSMEYWGEQCGIAATEYSGDLDIEKEIEDELEIVEERLAAWTGFNTPDHQADIAQQLSLLLQQIIAESNSAISGSYLLICTNGFNTANSLHESILILIEEQGEGEQPI